MCTNAINTNKNTKILQIKNKINILNLNCNVLYFYIEITRKY